MSIQLDGDESIASSHANSGEKQLTFEGFKCPTRLVNDFTPDQFEEMVTMFRKYDVDNSQTVDLTELVKMLNDLDMGHTAEDAVELLEIIDEDKSGEIDFGEFCDLFSRLMRGDKQLRGFNKLTEALNETPVSILMEQCTKRSLKCRFGLLEQRPASSMHAAHYVVEAALNGIWYDRDKDGKPVKFEGTKKFQGIGKSTRDAKFKAAAQALNKLMNNMPGLAHPMGVLPDNWLKWAHENLENGVDETKVLKGLIDKGFVPAMSTHLMQSLTLLRHFRKALKENPLLLVGEEMGDVGDSLDAFLDEHLRLGFDGSVLLQTLEQFGFEVERNPTLVHRLRRHEVSVGSGIHMATALEPMVAPANKMRDFFRACSEGAFDEVELYISAAQPIDLRKLTPTSQARSGLMCAAANGHRMVVRLLLQHHADPNFADANGRTALHHAAMQGHVGVIVELDRFGGDMHITDNQHNTPLHLASKRNKLRAVSKLVELEQDAQRRVVTGGIPAVEGTYDVEGATLVHPISFEDLCYQCYSEFMVSKNHPKDLPRFRKDWIYEACLWIYDHFTETQKRFVTLPSIPIAEYVLKHKDPHKQNGYYLGIRSKEIYVKTCDSHEDALFLITEIYRMAACHSLNKLGRTPLHEACFENKVDSHAAIIDMMVNKQFCNLELRDLHGRRAMDELIIRRGRPGSPTALDIKEKLVHERRDNWVALMYQERAQDRRNEINQRKAETLAQCSDIAFNLNRPGWELVQTASQPMFIVGPYFVYEDVDSNNFFYVKKSISKIAVQLESSSLNQTEKGNFLVKRTASVMSAGSSIGDDEDEDSDYHSSDYDTDDESIADKQIRQEKKQRYQLKLEKQAQEKAMAKQIEAEKDAEELKIKYNWIPPNEFLINLKLLLATDSVRNRCHYVRSVKGWDMIRCPRLHEIWYCKPDLMTSQFTCPLECRFENLLLSEHCVQKGNLGKNGKWLVIQDEDNNIFYLNKRKAIKTAKIRMHGTEADDEEDEDNQSRQSAKFDLKTMEWPLGSFGPLDARWERPEDAVRWENGGPLSAATILNGSDDDETGAVSSGGSKPEFLVEERCTRFLGANKPLHQIWYSCDALTQALKKEKEFAKEEYDRLKAEEIAKAGAQKMTNNEPSPFANEDYGDRFRCCGPCFRKLMRSHAQVVKKVNEMIPSRKGNRYEATMKKSLNDPSHKILGGYGEAVKTLKFVKSSKVLCCSILLPGIEPAGVGIAKAAYLTNQRAKLVDEEILRHEEKKKNQPCLLACVPNTYPPSKYESKLKQMNEKNNVLMSKTSKSIKSNNSSFRNTNSGGGGGMNQLTKMNNLSQTSPLTAKSPSLHQSSVLSSNKDGSNGSFEENERVSFTKGLPAVPGSMKMLDLFPSNTSIASSIGSVEEQNQSSRTMVNPKQFRSWQLCRMRKDSAPMFGWIPCHDPEPRNYIEPGTTVRARKVGDDIGWHLGIVKQRRGSDYFDVAFSSKEIRYKTPRCDIDDDGDVFWFHVLSGRSQWHPPDEVAPFENDRLRKLAQTESAAIGGGGGARSRSSRGSSSRDVSESSSSKRNRSKKQQLVETEPSSSSSSSFNIDDVFTLKYNNTLKFETVPWPFYSGQDYEEFVARCNFQPHREDIAGYDEFVDSETGGVIYRNREIHKEEQAARFIQSLIRSKKSFPILPFWESQSYTFDIPPEVSQACYDRGGWAYLKRRSRKKKVFLDEGEQPWAEYLDAQVTNDVFYVAQEVNKGWSTWRNPLIDEEDENKPDDDFSEFDVGSTTSAHETIEDQQKTVTSKTTTTNGSGDENSVLEVGDKCLFRFVESPDLVSAIIQRVHIDDETEEVLYDLHDEAFPDNFMKNVHRFAIMLPQKTPKEIQEEKQAKNLYVQLHRAREAEERRLEVERLEEAEAERRKRRGPGVPKSRDLVPLTMDEIESYREERAAHEKRDYDNAIAAEKASKEKESAHSVVSNFLLHRSDKEGGGDIDESFNQSSSLKMIEDGDDGEEGDIEDGGKKKVNQWVKKSGIGSLLGVKGKLAREQNKVLEGYDLMAEVQKEDYGQDAKKKKKNRGHLSRRSKRVAASRNARDRKRHGLQSGDGGDDGFGGSVGSYHSHENSESAFSISSDSGTTSSSEDDAGPPMSVEDEMALRDAREKMTKQKAERIAARVADRKEKKDREDWLAEKEDGMASPRTVRRRVVHRNMYRALLRMHDNFTICRWGCGLWMREGHHERVHQRDLCPKRITQCALKCPCRLREEEWLKPYVPPKRPNNMNDPYADEEVDAGGAADESTEEEEEGGQENESGILGWKNEAIGAFAFAMEGTNNMNSRLDTVQRHHEKNECPRRLVRCTRKCGEWIHYEDLPKHLADICVKRPFPPLVCRLGCGETFSGGVHRMVACEEERLEHEAEVCEFRIVRCTWKGCASTFPANHRTAHRRKHINASGVICYTVPGNYKYKVESGVTQIQVQLWGGGGGSGGLYNQVAGSGGGGAFVEALVKVREGEMLELTVGGGGGAGTPGTEVITEDPNDPSASHVEEVIGQAQGGFPGGGHGHSSNTAWAAGGGGGYSMVQRKAGGGAECVLVAAGGGGAGSCDGVPGGTESGELPGMRLDKLNGRMGTDEIGGAAGDSGEGLLCTFGSEVGKAWQAGSGASYGGGGGGGYFGGGGGGVAPGIVGAGGGGSSYANKNICQDVVFLQGEGWKPGGFNGSPIASEGDVVEDNTVPTLPNSPASLPPPEISEKCKPGYDLPYATGMHELDMTGGYVGEGARANVLEWKPGKNGCVRIKRPGFYKDYDPNQHAKPYIGLARHQEVLLPMGTPVATVLERAEKAHKDREDLLQ